MVSRMHEHQKRLSLCLICGGDLLRFGTAEVHIATELEQLVEQEDKFDGLPFKILHIFESEQKPD